jgi:hypothetical protein
MKESKNAIKVLKKSFVKYESMDGDSVSKIHSNKF